MRVSVCFWGTCVPLSCLALCVKLGHRVAGSVGLQTPVYQPHSAGKSTGCTCVHVLPTG